MDSILYDVVSELISGCVKELNRVHHERRSYLWQGTLGRLIAELRRIDADLGF